MAELLTFFVFGGRGDLNTTNVAATTPKRAMLHKYSNTKLIVLIGCLIQCWSEGEWVFVRLRRPLLIPDLEFA